jgi:hypothetical protein
MLAVNNFEPVGLKREKEKPLISTLLTGTHDFIVTSQTFYLNVYIQIE